MGVFSPGTGGVTGGLPTQTPYESETTAYAAVVSQQVGKLPNTDDVLFSQINPHTTWKYTSTPDSPVLPSMIALRMGGATPKQPDQTWVDQYKALLDLLPADVRQRLEQEKQLPADVQSQEYLDLDNVLQNAAKTMVWLQMIGKPMDPEAIAHSRIPLNFALPSVALDGVVQFGTQVVDHVRTYLSQIGPNDPRYDQISGIVNQIHSGLQELNDLGGPSGKQ